MVISKFICIPLLIFVPLMILFFESREKDFTVPPSAEVVEQKVDEWKRTRPSLQEGHEDALNQQQKPAVKPVRNPEQPVPQPVVEPEVPKAVIVKDALKGIDLEISPGLNHLQGMKAERLTGITKQLDPDLYPELVYLAYERLLDSAPDSSSLDRLAAGEYLRKNGRPLWNPEASSRVPVKVHLNVEAQHYEKAKEYSPKLEAAIFYGSGGTVEATVIVTEVAEGKNSISLTGQDATEAVAVDSVPNTEKMIVNAVQQIVTKTIKDKQLPILHTDKIHYTYYTRLTWLWLADSL